MTLLGLLAMVILGATSLLNLYFRRQIEKIEKLHPELRHLFKWTPLKIVLVVASALLSFGIYWYFASPYRAASVDDMVHRIPNALICFAPALIGGTVFWYRRLRILRSRIPCA